MHTRETIERSLAQHGVENASEIHWNLSTPALYEEAIRRREGRLAQAGPLVVRTGQYTGRSPNDKFLVEEPGSRDHVWWGTVNRPMDEAHFDALHRRMLAYLEGKDVFVQDLHVCADPDLRMPIRVISEAAWAAMFARTMFIRPLDGDPPHERPQFTVLHTPHFHGVPERDNIRSEVFVVIHFGKRLVLIGGTQYAGEIKKSIFTILNYVLPRQRVLSMHCSANIGPAGDTALFFGLSGTGKTTLSADPARLLIGDDEHGWTDRGIFNLEGGCYAKVIRLSAKAEPEIYETTRRFGTILENVGFDSATGKIDLDDESLTENTRAAYPITHISNAKLDGLGGHPANVMMLTADAFGVLPPIARLDPAQAMYHFLSGYTAKVAGTEKGVTEPQATFSACFGAPFLVLPPFEYAKLLGERIARHKATVWLVNTGWTGGPYGVGHRMPIAHTRAIIRAALDGSLAQAPVVTHPIFKLAVPTACPGVPSEVLDPRSTWADGAAYDAQARKLAGMFAKNFAQFEEQASPEVRKAGLRAD